MAKNYTGGLNFSWPTADENDWEATVDAALESISEHDHSGGGNGTPLSGNSIAANGINGTRIRLANNEALRARNAAGSADVDLLKLNTSNLLELVTALASFSVSGTADIAGLLKMTSTENVSSSGALSVATVGTVLSGNGTAATLANGVEGQIKWVVYNAAADTHTATITPATTAGANTVKMGRYGFVLYVFYSGEWRLLASNRVQITDSIAESFAAAGTWTGTTDLVICTGTTYTVTTPAGYEGQTVLVRNQASGNVTFGSQVMATGTYYLYSYLNAGWRRVALT